ncbi:MAG TPA: protein kinase, partial [Clostridia bacterium]|nr:protein kinase [Clostridia bacterium]
MNNSIEGFMLNKKYRLIERIGLGGTAIVFKGEDVRTGETVAIKILKEEYAQDEEFIRRFRKEAEAAMKLNHPNIVSVKDIGQDGNVIYIVMEYVDGVTLKDYIDAMQYISWQDTLVIAKQILEAVDHAHEKQIIHRDIKPMNIMVSDSSDIKLTDFGIARAVSNSTIQANDNSAGSVHYLSPEQARGGFVDERSDIYSIGITLYELITGVVPFDGDSHISIALKHLDGKIIPPKEVDPEIPKGVNDLIVMATRKDPGKRFQSARDMLSRLYKVIENPHHSFLDEEYEPAYEPVDTALMENAVREVDEVEEVAAEPEYPYVNTAEIVRSVTMKT